MPPPPPTHYPAISSQANPPLGAAAQIKSANLASQQAIDKNHIGRRSIACADMHGIHSPNPRTLPMKEGMALRTRSSVARVVVWASLGAGAACALAYAGVIAAGKPAG